ncbi:nicotinamide-nucleotide adenylyltransferase [Patescibacteria group bacterium]
MKQALFVGRFQPFHNGHLDAIKSMLENEDRVVLVIGSAEENNEPANPFTAGERFQMIEVALGASGIDRDKYVIIPVRNVKNFMLWTAHVDQYIPPVYKVYTGSQIVRELYQSYGKYEIASLDFNFEVHGTLVREKMLKGDKTWVDDVHPKVAELIKKWKGVERLKMIA